MLTRKSIFEWVTTYLETFRQRALETDWSRYEVGNLDDFRAPLQIVVFPIQPVGVDALVTLLVGVRLRGQPDGLVEVLEPMNPSDVSARVEQFLADGRWDAELSDELTLPGEDYSARTTIASAVAFALQESERQILRAGRGQQLLTAGHAGKLWLPGGGFAWHLRGDFTAHDVPTMVGDSIRRRPPTEAKPDPAPPRPSPPHGFGAYFYPFVWLGDRPARSVADIIMGARGAPLMSGEPVHEFSYQGHPLFAERTGFIALGCDDRQESLELLNQIMAFVWLSGMPVTSVHDAELIEVTLDQDRSAIGGRTTRLVSLRNLEAFEPGYRRSDLRFAIPVLEWAALESALRGAETLCEEPGRDLEMTLLHDAFTAVGESKSREGILTAWIALEHWLYRQWKEALRSRGRSEGGIKRLDQRDWTASVVAESLEMMGGLTAKTLSSIHAFRKLRNKVIHEGYAPTEDEATAVVSFGKSILFAPTS